MMSENVILVNEADVELGSMDKLLVHQLGLLHRAFSVFIFNTKGELLLQQRSDNKYHSAGLWSNTCCSHPRVNEPLAEAVERRLLEEMGMNCKTVPAFKFIYKANFKNGLTENEYDHVYFGITDDLPVPDSAEVKNWKYIKITSLQDDIAVNPHLYTEWIKICLPQVVTRFGNILYKSTV